jgi:hypothetical protein
MGWRIWSAGLSVLAGGVLAVLLGSSALAFQSGTGTPLSPRPLDQLQRSVTRPVPVAPRSEVVPPDHVWVPDRYVSVPGVPEGLHIPAHWERRLSNGRLYAPPLVGCRPGTSECRTIPAGSHVPWTGP